MHPAKPNPSRAAADGFTLPAILVVVAALLVLAVGLLLVSGVERRTARSFVERQRAELAARAGLEEVKGIFLREAANDDFLIVPSNLVEPIEEGRQPAPALFLTRGSVSGGKFAYRHVPLFSNIKIPDSSANLKPPLIEPLLGGKKEEYIDFATLPYLDKARASWMPVKDPEEKVVGRYAFWVEDLQGKIDPAIAGNKDGSAGEHAHNTYPDFIVPGINLDPDTKDMPALDRIGLYAIDGTATDTKPGELEKTLIDGRKMLVSPDSLLAAAGVNPPITRLTKEKTESNGKVGKIGDLVDVKARAIEQSLASNIQSYKERPVVSFVEGISPSMAGQPKLNLNKLLATGGDAAVDEMAKFVEDALPYFSNKRKGGFPMSENYVKTLAANAIDYADSDSESTVKAGSHRGIDAFPLVSEFIMSFDWTGIVTENGRKLAVIEVTTFAELWNMSDKPVEGKVQLTYETKYEVSISPFPVNLDDVSLATPTLSESDGYRWFPEQTIALQPDQYKVFKFGTMTYKIDGGAASGFILSPLSLDKEEDGSSGASYRLKWNGKIVDQARGGVNRYGASLNYPEIRKDDKLSQKVRMMVPSHSHRRTGVYRENMGDTRMSYYLQAPADQYSYPQNYSPNRRNMRYGSVYSSNQSTVWGRVMPSEWPDGGHNSEYGSNAFFSTYSIKDEWIEPDDVRFFKAAELPSPKREEAPVRISNKGRFYSATELGRVSDPIMWNVALPSSSNFPWGDVATSADASTDHGGGNTLRIGRPEHPMFTITETDEEPKGGRRAIRWLDLFHAGISRSDDSALREGPVIEINGHVNVNTASRDVLRALIAGPLGMDPNLSVRTSETHNKQRKMAPPVQLRKLSPPTIKEQGDRIADAIIRSRPFATTANIALAEEADGTLVFGNRALFANPTKIHWADAAAEELFARVYEATTVRSRNFRVWVVGQSLAPLDEEALEAGTKPEVLAEVRKSYTVFADPGERGADGAIDSKKTKLTILHENDF